MEVEIEGLRATLLDEIALLGDLARISPTQRETTPDARVGGVTHVGTGSEALRDLTGAVVDADAPHPPGLARETNLENQVDVAGVLDDDAPRGTGRRVR